MELPCFRIGNPEFTINCYHETAQCGLYIPGILTVHCTGLVPDHLFPEQCGEFFHLCTPEFFRQYHALNMITGTGPCLFRGQGKMVRNKHDAGNESVTEGMVHSTRSCPQNKKK